jgi:hypothetical protein
MFLHLRALPGEMPDGDAEPLRLFQFYRHAGGYSVPEAPQFMAF